MERWASAPQIQPPSSPSTDFWGDTERSAARSRGGTRVTPNERPRVARPHDDQQVDRVAKARGGARGDNDPGAKGDGQQKEALLELVVLRRFQGQAAGHGGGQEQGQKECGAGALVVVVVAAAITAKSAAPPTCGRIRRR